MWLWIAISITLTLFYLILQYSYVRNWESVLVTNISHAEPYTFVSIIIPARNEENNIVSLLDSIIANNYTRELYEIIVIDDFSEDNTYEYVINTQITNLSIFHLKDLLPKDAFTEAYKKRAIEAAVHIAKGELIITTDADCTVGKDWLRSLVSIYEREKCELIVAPVIYKPSNNFFEEFQALDFLGMIAITFASIRMRMYNMANGANFAFSKSAFLKVGGYKGIDHKASGDDMLLVYKIANAFQGKVGIAKSVDSVVYSSPMPDLHSFLQQRYRWTSKASDYQDKRITLILAGVYLFVVSILLNFIGSIFYKYSLCILFLFQIVIKTFSDYILLNSAANFFDRKYWMRNFVYKEMAHILYIIFVGTIGNFVKYNWKGRKLK
jgi:cellulose synthase/poly-beta-1,6-N-acetylglucosamine synthase-like glycosyltransferase